MFIGKNDVELHQFIPAKNESLYLFADRITGKLLFQIPRRVFRRDPQTIDGKQNVAS